MPTAAEGLVGGEWAAIPPLAEAIAKGRENPEWHSLRLLGRGRQSGLFDARVETRNEL
jgi:hypothetical protein